MQACVLKIMNDIRTCALRLKIIDKPLRPIESDVTQEECDFLCDVETYHALSAIFYGILTMSALSDVTCFFGKSMPIPKKQLRVCKLSCFFRFKYKIEEFLRGITLNA